MITAAVLLAWPGRVLWLAALAVAGLMLVVWVVSVRLRDVSIVDVAWGPAFGVVALVAALVGPGCPGRRWLLFGVTGLWGLRLAGHLARRKLAEPGEDRRYRQMRTRHPDRFTLWSLGAVFAPQAVLVLLVSLPVQVAAGRPGPLSAWIAPGLVVFFAGLIFETVGDEQLRRFKREPDSRGQVMDRGLWRYTRHPNYFGDACVWWGIWLIALPAGDIWWTVIGPAVMTFLLVRVSGKELLERDLSQRPGYREYVERTSGFIPLPPRSVRRGGPADDG